VASWTFLTHHARVLLLVAHDPGARLRDIAASLNITERSAFGILTDLVEAGPANFRAGQSQRSGL
jgi:DNA-binding MarR family transcriptional regulator